MPRPKRSQFLPRLPDFLRHVATLRLSDRLWKRLVVTYLRRMAVRDEVRARKLSREILLAAQISQKDSYILRHRLRFNAPIVPELTDLERDFLAFLDFRTALERGWLEDLDGKTPIQAALAIVAKSRKQDSENLRIQFHNAGLKLTFPALSRRRS